jgi:hypothetical protein
MPTQGRSSRGTRGGTGPGQAAAMGLPVVLSIEAEAEFDAAVDWDEQQAGLGAAFVAQVRGVLNRIGQLPELHRVVSQNIRRAQVRRSPYCISYRVQPDPIGWRRSRPFRAVEIPRTGRGVPNRSLAGGLPTSVSRDVGRPPGRCPTIGGRCPSYETRRLDPSHPPRTRGVRAIT